MKFGNVALKAKELGFVCRENEMMSAHTTFRIGGPAKVFIECNDIEKLWELLAVIRAENVPFWVVGKGSNLLISDNGLDGVVLYICDDAVTVNENKISANAGAKLSTVCLAARDASLTGLEFAWGIPGSVGGAVYMNAGAYGGEIKQTIISATSITLDGELKHYDADQLELGYRTSIFKKNGEIILSAVFRLETAEKQDIQAKMDDFLGRRKNKQPLEYPSAGSTFKRPEGYFAGALIEQSNLKGFSVGGAEVSVKHAGFVINKNNATCKDVLGLIKHIQSTVKTNFNVDLESEVIFVE